MFLFITLALAAPKATIGPDGVAIIDQRALRGAVAVAAQANVDIRNAQTYGAVAVIDASGRLTESQADAYATRLEAQTADKTDMLIAGAVLASMHMRVDSNGNVIPNGTAGGSVPDVRYRNGDVEFDTGKAAFAANVSPALDNAMYNPYAGYGSMLYGVDPNANLALQHLRVIDQAYATQVPMGSQFVAPTSGSTGSSTSDVSDADLRRALEAAKRKNR